MGFKRFFSSYFFQECTKLLTVTWSIGFTILLCILWIQAFLEGGSTIISVCTFGEQYFELALGIFFIPYMLYGFVLFVHEFRTKKRRMRKSIKWFLMLEKEETL